MKQKIHLYRAEPGRFTVAAGCRGVGHTAVAGDPFRFRGIDASHHGFGCIFSRCVEKDSTVVIGLGHHRLTFQVMWCESHLGIEDMYRVGLISMDPNVNIETILNQLGYLEVLSQHAS